MSTTESNLPTVLFKDYNGYWRDLKSLYWSQSSQKLVSRHPNSVVEEIVSQYCPQCLTRYSGEEVQTQQDRCASCYQCPCCEGLLVLVPVKYDTPAVAVIKKVPTDSNSNTKSEAKPEAEAKAEVEVEESSNMGLVLFCEMCMWQSTDSGVDGATKAEIDATIKKKDSEKQADAFAVLLKNYKDKTSSSVDSKLRDLSMSLLKRDQGHWQMEQIETKIAATAAKVHADDSFLFEGGKEIVDNSVYNHQDIYTCDRDSALTDLTQRRKSENSQPCSFKNLIPERLELLAKKTIRCRKDLEEGKMNILIQPKTFPLEGDSSLKIQRGKWWVKDMSAVHEIPFVCIHKLPDSSKLLAGEYASLHVSICNPKDCDIELLFNGSETVVDSTDPEYYEDTSHRVMVEASVNYGKASGYANGAPELALTIGAYEDELLKDSAEDGQSSGVISGNQGGKQDAGSALLDMATHSPPWVYKVESNIAYIQIPLKLSSSTTAGAVLELKEALEKAAVQSGTNAEGGEEGVESPLKVLEMHLKASMRILGTIAKKAASEGELSPLIKLPIRFLWDLTSTSEVKV